MTEEDNENDDVSGPLVAVVYEETEEHIKVSIQTTNMDKTHTIGALVTLKHAIEEKVEELLSEKPVKTTEDDAPDTD